MPFRAVSYQAVRRGRDTLGAMDTRFPTLTTMPDGFYWKPRCHLDTLPTGLFLDGEIVASMLDRVDGTWLARLHLGDQFPNPMVMRHCTSFEQGRRGAELWALRHEAELRAQVGAKLEWIQRNVVHGASRIEPDPT